MPYTRPYANGFKDSPDTTTPINSTALNTMDLGIKTANDQIQTVTTAQRTALTGLVVGQMVWDSDLREFFVYMNATGGNAWQGMGNLLICTSTTRPLTPYAGQKIYETDTRRSLVYESGAWRLDTFNRYAVARRTSGGLLLTGTTSWSNVDTALDLTLNASAGDVIEVAAIGLWNTEAIQAMLDVVTIPGGVVTNSIGHNGAVNPTGNGIAGWLGVTSVLTPISGSAFYTLVSGDIASNTVTLRLRYRMTAATNKTLIADTGTPFSFFARNLGQVTT